MKEEKTLSLSYNSAIYIFRSPILYSSNASLGEQMWLCRKIIGHQNSHIIPHENRSLQNNRILSKTAAHQPQLAVFCCSQTECVTNRRSPCVPASHMHRDDSCACHLTNPTALVHSRAINTHPWGDTRRDLGFSWTEAAVSPDGLWEAPSHHAVIPPHTAVEDSSFNGLLVTMETNKRSVWVRELKKERAENPLLFKGIPPLSNKFCPIAWGRASGGALVSQIAVGKLQALKKVVTAYPSPIFQRHGCAVFSQSHY